MRATFLIIILILKADRQGFPACQKTTKITKQDLQPSCKMLIKLADELQFQFSYQSLYFRRILDPIFNFLRHISNLLRFNF